MIRSLFSAGLVLAGALAFAVPSASAAVIFSWDPDFGFGPTFTLHNGLETPLSDFRVDLELEGAETLSYELLTETDPDGDGIFSPSTLIPGFGSVQLSADLFGLSILNAWLRWDHGTVRLLDPETLGELENGLMFEGSLAEVQLVTAVAEPGTLILLGMGAAAALLRRRRQDLP